MAWKNFSKPFYYSIMSLYDSLTNSGLRVKRRLFDSAVERLGRTVKVIRIQYREDMYQDITDIHELSTNEVSAIINFTEEIPLNRYRYEGTDHVEDTRTFFFDVLPIEVYTRLEDTLELRDLLFFWLTDENSNKIPMLLQVTETLGRFSTGLIWKRSLCAPVYGALTKPLYKTLKDYYTPEKIDTMTDEPLLRDNPEEAPDPDLVRERRVKDIMG